MLKRYILLLLQGATVSSAFLPTSSISKKKESLQTLELCDIDKKTKTSRNLEDSHDYCNKKRTFPNILTVGPLTTFAAPFCSTANAAVKDIASVAADSNNILETVVPAIGGCLALYFGVSFALEFANISNEEQQQKTEDIQLLPLGEEEEGVSSKQVMPASPVVESTFNMTEFVSYLDFVSETLESITQDEVFTTEIYNERDNAKSVFNKRIPFDSSASKAKIPPKDSKPSPGMKRTPVKLKASNSVFTSYLDMVNKAPLMSSYEEEDLKSVYKEQEKAIEISLPVSSVPSKDKSSIPMKDSKPQEGKKRQPVNLKASESVFTSYLDIVNRGASTSATTPMKKITQNISNEIEKVTPSEPVIHKRIPFDSSVSKAKIPSKDSKHSSGKKKAPVKLDASNSVFASYFDILSRIPGLSIPAPIERSEEQAETLKSVESRDVLDRLLPVSSVPSKDKSSIPMKDSKPQEGKKRQPVNLKASESVFASYLDIVNRGTMPSAMEKVTPSEPVIHKRIPFDSSVSKAKIPSKDSKPSSGKKRAPMKLKASNSVFASYFDILSRFPGLSIPAPIERSEEQTQTLESVVESEEVLDRSLPVSSVPSKDKSSIPMKDSKPQEGKKRQPVNLKASESVFTSYLDIVNRGASTSATTPMKKITQNISNEIEKVTPSEPVIHKRIPFDSSVSKAKIPSKDSKHSSGKKRAPAKLDASSSVFASYFDILSRIPGLSIPAPIERSEEQAETLESVESEEVLDRSLPVSSVPSKDKSSIPMKDSKPQEGKKRQPVNLKASESVFASYLDIVSKTIFTAELSPIEELPEVEEELPPSSPMLSKNRMFRIESITNKRLPFDSSVAKEKIASKYSKPVPLKKKAQVKLNAPNSVFSSYLDLVNKAPALSSPILEDTKMSEPEIDKLSEVSHNSPSAPSSSEIKPQVSNPGSSTVKVQQKLKSSESDQKISSRVEVEEENVIKKRESDSFDGSKRNPKTFSENEFDSVATDSEPKTGEEKGPLKPVVISDSERASLVGLLKKAESVLEKTPEASANPTLPFFSKRLSSIPTSARRDSKPKIAEEKVLKIGEKSNSEKASLNELLKKAENVLEQTPEPSKVPAEPISSTEQLASRARDSESKVGKEKVPLKPVVISNSERASLVDLLKKAETVLEKSPEASKFDASIKSINDNVPATNEKRILEEDSKKAVKTEEGPKKEVVEPLTAHEAKGIVADIDSSDDDSKINIVSSNPVNKALASSFSKTVPKSKLKQVADDIQGFLAGGNNHTSFDSSTSMNIEEIEISTSATTTKTSPPVNKEDLAAKMFIHGYLNNVTSSGETTEFKKLYIEEKDL